MFDLVESSRRISAVYRGRRTDRVPIISPIAWSPHADIDAQPGQDWRGEERFVKVARLVQEHCDPAPPFNAVGYPRVFAAISYQRFCEAPDEYVEELPPEPLPTGRIRHTTLLHTPKGDLRYVYEAQPGILTRWDIHRPIQSARDVERMLSVPYRFDPPAPAEFAPFRRHRAEMGRDCIGGGGVNSMVAMLCGMMSFQQLLEWVMTEPGLIEALADAWLERTRQKVDFLLDQGVGPIWHFNGVERASPPMMGPRQWQQWVVPYDGRIMRQIKARDPESLIHVHCHGRVGTLLDSFIDMGVDSIDPVEPPPQGDIEFAQAKARARGRLGSPSAGGGAGGGRGRLTLFGNIEFLDMDTAGPDEIERKVRRAIEDGGKDHTILCPSATPHQRHTDRFTANAVRYIEAGLKYGTR